MTDEAIIAAIRQVLVEELIPEVRALSAKLDGLRDSLEQSTQRILAKMQSFHDDIVEIRADMAEIRAELQATREKVFGASNSSRLIQ
jgi:capsule polysaccharide export protein KpsE/RkpR